MEIYAARDEIFTRFRTQWEADTPALNGGTSVLVEWEGVEKLNPPPTNAPWARATVVHSEGNQRTLGGIGGRRFGRSGNVFIQVFAPRGQGQGLLDRLCAVAVSAFEGKKTPSGVWFRAVSVNEIPQSGNNPWVSANVVAEFNYDKIF